CRKPRLCEGQSGCVGAVAYGTAGGIEAVPCERVGTGADREPIGQGACHTRLGVADLCGEDRCAAGPVTQPRVLAGADESWRKRCGDLDGNGAQRDAPDGLRTVE